MAGKKRLTQRLLDEREVPGGRAVTLTFRADDGPSATSPVPSVLRLPRATGRVPAALLLHGYASRKEDMAESAGEALLPLGIASLSIDLPLHGDRADPFELRSVRNPFDLVARWRTAIDEAQLALRFLAARPEIDRDRLALIGYSLGSYLSLAVAERDRAPRAVVLAAGGDLPDFPFAQLIRGVADPLRAVRALAGRPLLMVHGRRDRTILPTQAERLFTAAQEPKEIQWWDAGHYLPDAAVKKAAEWVARTLGASADAHAMR
jgi:predicted esterase